MGSNGNFYFLCIVKVFNQLIYNREQKYYYRCKIRKIRQTYQGYIC